MTRTPEFEDMNATEWPDELRTLRSAAANAYDVYYDLDELATNAGESLKKRGTFQELAGRAWALLRDLRAEGLRQLAEWEESQKTEEEDYQRKRIENWNAVADGLQPPHPSEY